MKIPSASSSATLKRMIMVQPLASRIQVDFLAMAEPKQENKARRAFTQPITNRKAKPTTPPRDHSISLMCDDINKTVSELQAKGAQFPDPVQNEIYGHLITNDRTRRGC